MQPRLGMPTAFLLLTAALLLAPAGLAQSFGTVIDADTTAQVLDAAVTPALTALVTEDAPDQTDDETVDQDDDAPIDMDADHALAQVHDVVDPIIADLPIAIDTTPDATRDEPAPSDPVAPATTASTDIEVLGAGVDSNLIAAGFFAAVAIGAVAAKSGLVGRVLTPAFATLFSRFRASDLLDHPRRAELHGLVCRNPGITVPDLADATGLSRNTIMHHLRMLHGQDMLVPQSMGRQVHWYENGGRYGRDRKEAYAVLHDDRSRDVAAFILANPGRSQNQVADALGLAPSVVTWHMQRLEGAELVQRRRDGRRMLCFPHDLLASISL